MNAHDVGQCVKAPYGGSLMVPDPKEMSLVGETTKSSQRVKYWDSDPGRDSLDPREVSWDGGWG